MKFDQANLVILITLRIRIGSYIDLVWMINSYVLEACRVGLMESRMFVLEMIDVVIAKPAMEFVTFSLEFCVSMKY